MSFLMRTPRFFLRSTGVLLVFALPTVAWTQSEKQEYGKLSYALHRVAKASERQELAFARGLRYLDSNTRMVTAVIVLSPGATASDVAGVVRDAGGRIEGQFRELVKVELPVTAVRRVARHAAVSRMRPPYYPGLKEITSEGAPVIGADDFIGRMGVDGSGVVVGVLDVGFQNAEGLIGSELPAEQTSATPFVLDNLDEFESAHGTACAEIIHDIAPGAELYLAAFEDLVSWGEQLDQLIVAGVDIISHSIGFDNLYPPDGHHIIAQTVDEITASGILFVTAAGNEAEHYYQGTWQDIDQDGFLEFGDQNLFGASIVVHPYETTEVRLRWDDPFGASEHDYDLFVVKPGFVSNWDISEDNPDIVASSRDVQSGVQNPLELLSFESEEEVLYAIVRHDPASPLNSSQKFYLWASNNVSANLATPEGTLTLPADALGALSVGAIMLDSLEVQSFSSRGPTADGRMKPDLVAPDLVSTVTFGERQFSGTSASTPHVAGAAALVLSANPFMDVASLRGALEAATNLLGRETRNNDIGLGLIDLRQLR
jgi:subtilisin family serine protease